ncbi:MAG: leuA [Acidobacteria bacterium]|nr:leuA [Acidobacteriota bacterium]
MTPEVEIYDTTLRDGTQGHGISFSVADKLRIADRLDGFGVHYIEGGWPGSNPRDIEFFAEAKHRTFRNARLAAFGSTRRKDVAAADDDQVQLLIAANTPVVTIFGKTSPLHVREVLQTTLDENLKMIADTVRFLKANGKFVVYDAEHCFDGFKEDTPYALTTLHAAEQAGADVITLCDTNGGSLPSEVAAITRLAREQLRTRVGIHTHDDIGLGVANALASIEAGATHVQGTINGYGERTGNCNITSVIPILHFKLHTRGVPAASLPLLTELSQFVDETANLRPNPRLPWVGSSAFSHKGGTHVNAVAKVLSSYEHVDPASVGNTRHVLISDLAGRSNIVMKARELGFDLSSDAVHLKTMLAAIKDMEHRGYEFEAADGSLTLLIRRVLSQEPPPFTVDAYHVSMRSEGGASVCEATVKVRVGNERAHTVADGDGPVNALDAALRSALGTFYPQLHSVRLTDYKVRIIDSTTGTAATTRVLIQSTDGVTEWGTIGVNENIVEASLQALVDSLECALINIAAGA